jgi:hypothetical protein
MEAHIVQEERIREDECAVWRAGSAARPIVKQSYHDVITYIDDGINQA